jgi:hypothetical protein
MAQLPAFSTALSHQPFLHPHHPSLLQLRFDDSKLLPLFSRDLLLPDGLNGLVTQVGCLAKIPS